MPREPTGSERQLVKTSHLAKFEPYVANGAHRANANMGIYSPTSRHQNLNPLLGIFIWRIWKFTVRRSHRKHSEQIIL